MLLGIDPATTTGWALWTPHEIIAGSITASGRTHGAKAASLSRELAAVCKGRDITMAAIEAPLPPNLSKKVFVNDLAGPRMEKKGITQYKTILFAYGVRMCFLATLHSLGIVTFEVNARAWRTSFFGKGVKGRDRDEWKRMAREYADRLGCQVANDDAAEAVGIVSWLAANQHLQTRLGKQLSGPRMVLA